VENLVQDGVPFGGELVHAGMVVVIHEHLLQQVGRTTQRIRPHGELGDSAAVIDLVHFDCVGSEVLGCPITVAAVMFPFAVVADDSGHGGILDLRHKRFMLAAAHYRQALQVLPKPSQSVRVVEDVTAVPPQIVELLKAQIRGELQQRQPSARPRRTRRK